MTGRVGTPPAIEFARVRDLGVVRFHPPTQLGSSTKFPRPWIMTRPAVALPREEEGLEERP